MAENFLITKLQRDFLDCVSVDKAILMGGIRKEEGTLMLFDLIDIVKSDIATLDKDTWDMLNVAEKKLLADNNERKKVYRNIRPKDSSEKRGLQIKMLMEDYLACKEILYFIQNLCYKKGWFQ